MAQANHREGMETVLHAELVTKLEKLKDGKNDVMGNVGLPQ